jgi:hypothetical protein
VPPWTSESLHFKIVGYLRDHSYATLVELTQSLFPDSFTDDDLRPRQLALERLRVQCAQLVESKVLATAYSPTDGDLVYCIREVFQGEGVESSPGSNGLAAPSQSASPAVFRRRGEVGWRNSSDTGEAAKSGDADPAVPTSGSDYAVFFKLGTVLRPTCDVALRNFALTAARAAQIHVIGLVSPLPGVADMPEVLASQRAAIVANRLVDCGIDRFRIELSVRPWDERPLSKDVFAVDPPRSLAAQARRVDINIRNE